MHIVKKKKKKLHFEHFCLLHKYLIQGWLMPVNVLAGPMTPFRSTRFLISYISFSYSFKGRSLSSAERQEQKPSIEPEVLMTKDIECTESWDRTERERDIRQGIDLATTLERIEKNFVITDPRLPDNPIVR